MLQTSTIKFLKELKKNNNKPWFDANREKYEEAKKDFGQFIQSVIDKQAKKDPSVKELKAKDCMFRINRDIRFSKDKSPYKTNFGASINRGGKKSIFAGYYFHCEPGESFSGGGIWMPMPPELKKVRQEIDYNFDEFKKIIQSKKFQSAFGELYRGDDISLSKIPQGFEKNNPAAGYLKLKSFIAMKKISEADLSSHNLEKITLTTFDALQPLVEFINKALEE
ncbi:MAG: DUF2461 domain-containing protein [Bacteroidetes bacterium]|nr:DUF2461 domain-containing protein [Bacteroidota bacterium]